MTFSVETNVPIAPSVYRMALRGDTSGITAPGQFVNIAFAGRFLRRPISVFDWDSGGLTIIYKVVGEGTKDMAGLAPGARLDLLTGLGNGYDTDVPTTSPLLIGGGAGIPPLFALCKALREKGLKPQVILGFNAAAEVFCEDAFKALGAEVTVCTADGSCGVRGFVTAAMGKRSYDHFFACGPEPMLKAVCAASSDIPGQLSFEARMACGFGACMGCSCQTLAGNKRICVDGPVLRKEEIQWT